MFKKGQSRYFFITLLTILFIFATWVIITAYQFISPLFIPSPMKVWSSFLEISLGSGYKGTGLLIHLGISLYRIGAAFLFAILLAVPLGLFSGYNRTLRAVIAPFVYFYRPLPPLAYYTLLIIWLGIGDVSKIMLLFLAGFAPIFISSMSAMESIDPTRVIAARTLGASTKQVFVYVILPSILPQLFAGLRTALGFIYTTLVAAEMVAAVSGVGWMVLDAGKFLQSDVIFVGIIVMGLTGVLFDLAFNLLERKIVPWKGKGD